MSESSKYVSDTMHRRFAKLSSHTLTRERLKYKKRTCIFHKAVKQQVYN